MRTIEFLYRCVMGGVPGGATRIADCGSRPIQRALRHAAGCQLTVLLALAAFGAGSAPPENNARGGNSSGAWANGRVLVMPRAGLTEKELGKILSEHGGKGKKIGQSELYIVDLPANASEKAVAAILAHHPAFKFAEIDEMVLPDLIPNDPYYGSAWHLPKIGASVAWDKSQGAGVTVAILDSGVDSAHPDLGSKLVPGWNFYDNNANTSDVYGHGTKVAGAAAAASNNHTGIAAVAGQSRIMPIRVTNLSGGGYWSTITQGLVHAADNGARVANVSFLGVTSSLTVQNAAQYMKNKGGLVVVSGGNTGTQQNYASTTTMIPVAATDSKDVRASWSSYGTYIALAAPGAGIWSTIRGGGYGAVSGTSFSSPVSAGVVALMMSAAPQLQNTKIETLLFSTAVDLGAPGRDPYYGYGRVDAARAVQASVATVPLADTLVPSAAISSPSNGATVTGLVPVNVNATDNIGVARVELKVNSTTVAIDSTAPFGFSWDSRSVPNGVFNLAAYAFDTAGNVKASTAVAVNVANGTATVPKDTTAPMVKIVNPVAGNVSGDNVTISLNATDNSGAVGIIHTLYIDGVAKAMGAGSTLAYNWNIQTVSVGAHLIQAVVRDAAGNASSSSVQVVVVR
jgi:thermitase